ncbi:MAG: Fe-S protein assembly co-chaperone HscB [Alphaproteobacteria bacterium]
MNRRDGDVGGTCWSCGSAVPGDGLFCAACGVVQAPGEADHFARLGLPTGFAVDAVALERAYVERQRRLHPDRFVTRAARERRLSAEQSAAVNEAYATLKQPLERARYLLRLAGRAVAGEDGATIDDPAVLVEAMETREALAEADSTAAVGAVAARTAAAVAGCRDDLALAFAASDLDAAARLTTRLGYLTKLADEVRRRRVGLIGVAS